MLFKFIFFDNSPFWAFFIICFSVIRYTVFFCIIVTFFFQKYFQDVILEFFIFKLYFYNPKRIGWKLNMRKNKKNICIFIFFLFFQILLAYYFENVLLRVFFLFVLGVWLLYTKHLPQVQQFLIASKKYDLIFKKHWKSKDLRVSRWVLYFLIGIIIIYWLENLPVTLWTPIDNCYDPTGAKYVKYIKYVFDVWFLALWGTVFYYLGLAFYIIFFYDDSTLKFTLIKLGEVALKATFYGGLFSFWAAHLYTGLPTEPTVFSNFFDVYCYGGRGFGFELGNLNLKTSLYLCQNKGTLYPNLITYLDGESLTDEKLNLFLDEYPQYKPTPPKRHL